MRMQVEPVAEAVVMEVEDQVTATGTAPLVDKDLVAQLVGDAQRLGLSVEGEGGLLAQLTKLVLESALEGEMTAHLGYDKHERVEGSENARNGTRSKTVLTKAGPVEIAVPRDRAGSFEPVVVAKRQRRLGAIEDVVLSLSARGLTHGDISAHLADVYGSEVSKTTISTITDKVLDSMGEWQNRPLDPVYPVVFIDAIHVKVRDGQVANRPIYVALAVTVDGNRDILGLWAGDGGEGAKYWQQVLTEVKNRGVTDVLMLVCDGLKGLPESVGNVWPQTIVQTSSVHHGGGGMVPLLGCTVTVRTYANEHRGRSTCRPVRRWRGRPGIDWPAGSSTFECRDEVPGNRARRAGCRPSAAEGAAWSRRCPPRRSSVLTGAAANINCARLMTPGKC